MIKNISERITLANGVTMPLYGAGVFKISDRDTAGAVRDLIETGYRLIDTAPLYGNEEGVGRGVRDSGIRREAVFITTKLWEYYSEEESIIRAFEESLRRLNMDYVDLYLIHWPKPQLDLYVTMWKAFEKIYRSGRARAIGVSNFQSPHLDRLARECEIMPVLNQVEAHPFLTQQELREDLTKRGIVMQAWAPLARGRVIKDPVLNELGSKYGKSAVQVTLRWHLQHGVSAIPKSSKLERMQTNADIFDFSLTEDDLKRIDALHINLRTAEHPDTMNNN